MGLKIVWNSTAPWGGSSYSVLTERTVPDIVRMGHSVIVNTWYGLQGEPHTWPIHSRNGQHEKVGDVQIFPSVNGNAYGTDTMLHLYERAKANVLITCQDVWVIPTATTKQAFFAPWLPIDHAPPPGAVLTALETARYPMVYSRWGVDVLRESGIESHYVPCSCDANEYKPMDQAECRSRLGIPEHCDFLVTMVAANKDPDDRKGWGPALMGFKRFAEMHPNAMLYAHTNWKGAIDIGALVAQCGLQNRVVQCDQLSYLMGMMRDDYMRWAYCASDVLLNPAKSEGFGLPILEAQMCGTPVIATDYSTTDELLFAGWRIKWEPSWTAGAQSFRALPLVDSIADCLGAAYDERGNELLRKQARKGAEAYDTERVAQEYWLPALREIEDMVSGAGRGELKMVTF
jgi:glycosyltransferase involved in cell wall biosynthesis